MLSQIVFIAFFLAVCIRNSESFDTIPHICPNDNAVIAELNQHLQGVVPIVVIKETDPMTTSPEFKKFINDNYEHLIVVQNTDNACLFTDEILNTGLPNKVYPALFMANRGHLVKQKRVTQFTEKKLNGLKTAANSYSQKDTKVFTSISLLIGDQMSRAANPQAFLAAIHPGILQGNPVGYPMGPRPPVGNTQMPRMLPRGKPGPKPYYDTRSMSTGQSSGQPRQQMSIQMPVPIGISPNIQMTRPIVNYPNIQMTGPIVNYPNIQVTRPEVVRPIKPVARYPTAPKELDLLRTMEQGEGGSPGTPSMTHAWDYLSRSDPKRRRLDEGPSGQGQSP